MRRFPLAFALVGLLGLLSVGALVLGVLQAPTGTDLAVHNGAGETLLAARISGSYTTSDFDGAVVSFEYASGTTTEVARGKTGAVKARRTVGGATAETVLSPVEDLLSIPTFTLDDGVYRSDEKASVLVAPSQRSQVTGSYRAAVKLTGGYVVSVRLSIDATDRGQHVSETVDYTLTRVDGWRRG